MAAAHRYGVHYVCLQVLYSTRVCEFTEMAAVLECSASFLKLSRNAFLQTKRSSIVDLKYSARHYGQSTTGEKTVRIGCASGFWGDTAVSAPQLIHKGNINFLVFDYLSEITMSLLTAAKQKVPNLGYAPDFVQAGIGPHLSAIKQKGIRVVSNAGGINPLSCAAAIKEAAKKADVELKVAVVTGDDIMSQKSDIERFNVTDMFSGLQFPSSVTSMTAYLGAGAIQKALDLGADVVVTGRCTDSALTLGPLLHTFRWSHDNYDLLAAGSLAGHLIECGAQATGGIFTDWESVPDWHNIGFPIVECSANGEFILTKPPGTGGMVTPGTVSEQLVYEIGDPRRYILPDVICDFSNVKIEQIKGKEREAVRVSGAKGLPPTDSYKVSATYADGYRLTAVCVVVGGRAVAKARKTADAIIRRVQGIFKALGLEDFTKVVINVIGSEDSFGAQTTLTKTPRECTVWIAAHHKEKRALEILSREIAPAGTGMAPGLCGIVGGRPKVSPVLKLFSFLHPKDKVNVSVHLNAQTEEVKLAKQVDQKKDGTSVSAATEDVHQTSTDEVRKGSHSFRLEELAFARSGDKGNHCNIGVIARDPSFVPYLRRYLTAEAVGEYMAHVFEKDHWHIPRAERVLRFELPGINGFNFVLLNSLGGGGIASLRVDPQGKAFAQMLLDFRIENVPNLLKDFQSKTE